MGLLAAPHIREVCSNLHAFAYTVLSAFLPHTHKTSTLRASAEAISSNELFPSVGRSWPILQLYLLGAAHLALCFLLMDLQLWPRLQLYGPAYFDNF